MNVLLAEEIRNSRIQNFIKVNNTAHICHVTSKSIRADIQPSVNNGALIYTGHQSAVKVQR